MTQNDHVGGNCWFSFAYPGAALLQKLYYLDSTQHTEFFLVRFLLSAIETHPTEDIYGSLSCHAAENDALVQKGV